VKGTSEGIFDRKLKMADKELEMSDENDFADVNFNPDIAGLERDLAEFRDVYLRLSDGERKELKRVVGQVATATSSLSEFTGLSRLHFRVSFWADSLWEEGVPVWPKPSLSAKTLAKAMQAWDESKEFIADFDLLMNDRTE
jgi:hypothetical protein